MESLCSYIKGMVYTPYNSSSPVDRELRSVVFVLGAR